MRRSEPHNRRGRDEAEHNESTVSHLLARLRRARGGGIGATRENQREREKGEREKREREREIEGREK